MNINTKNNRKMLLGVIGFLLVITLTLTYAFFAGGAGPAANTDVNVGSGNTTKLTFSEGTPINLELNDTTLSEGGNDVSGSTTSSATLTLGTNVDSATEYYQVYFNVTGNEFKYTTAAKTPEILLSILDNEGNAVTLDGLTAVSPGVYDITEYKGLIKVAEDYEITGSATTTHEWEAQITFVNLASNQAANEGKAFDATLILQQPKMMVPDIAITPPEGCTNCGPGETVITPSTGSVGENNSTYDIYTVGYVTNTSETGVTYSLDIKIPGMDYSKQTLEVTNTKEVMSVLNDFENYIDFKSSGTISSGNNSQSAVATAAELLASSMDDSNLTIDSITMSCSSDKCTAVITESFSNLSSVTPHDTTKVDGSNLSAIYNGIMFNVVLIEKSDPCSSPTTSKDLILCHNGGQATIEAKEEPDFTQAAETNEGMFAASDEYGTSYYYRGAVDNNWMLYNGIYWRIVRIAGNESIKLLYSGTTAPTSSTATVMTGSGTRIGNYVFNSIEDDNAYVGYMYTLNQRQGLTVDSPMKTTLESWYTTNMSGVDSQIADNTFCYDRSLATAGYQGSYYGWNGSTYTGTGIGTSGTLYGTHTRLTASSSTLGPGGTGPELACPNKVDAYTVDDTTNGNGALSEKIGLLTVDEAVMAGLVPAISNSSNYLYTNSSYWLGSPFGFYSNHSHAHVWRVLSDGGLYHIVVYNSYIGLRPAVYLSNLVSISGTGTWNDPYKIN